MESNKNPISNISEIFSSNGENKESWSDLLCNIISSNPKTIQETVFFLKQKLNNKENVDLSLDIIDFFLNYGSQEIIEELAQKDFLNTILSLLKNKSKSGVNIQKKIIFLTQKWHQKFEKDENPKIKGFSDNYNILKKGGIIFPPQSYQIQTYNNYISEEESQNSLMKANAIKKLTKESEEIKKSMNFANPFSNESENSYDNQENNIFLDENTTVVTNNNNNNKNENENEIKKEKEKEELDDENPYAQNNNINIDKEDEKDSFNLFEKNNINQINNNNNFLTNKGESDDNNQLNNKNKQNEQESNYPAYPSQMSNLVNNNNFNNNNNQNPFSKTFNDRNQQRNNMNKMNNMNNNMNSNYKQFSNYNNRQNNNNNNNLQQKYKSSNPNFNANNNRNNYNKYNNPGSNYNNNNRGQNDYLMEAKYYKRTLGSKLLQLNAWINEGKFSFNSGRLKKGIQEILDELPYCNTLMQRYQKIGQKEAFETIKKMRLDIEQTCSRYEALMCDKKVEPFYSSFFGNTRQYYYNKNNMFGLNQNYEFYNFDNYYQNSGNYNNNYNNYNGNNFGNQNNNIIKLEKEKTFGDKLSDFGNDVKDGFIDFGNAVKNKAISGYEFIKKKFSDDDEDKNKNN